MRVAVIGAGVTGLVAAYRLSRAGHECHVYERWPGLGGQAATLDVGAPQPLERYYHHLFTSDVHMQALCAELGLGDEIEWWPSSVAIFSQGRSHPFSSPLDILRFRPLSPLARLRMGVAVVLLQRRHRSAEPFEDLTAADWVRRHMGAEVYEKVWGPLLRAKFGPRAEQLSMAWLWSKLTVRRQIKGRQARTELLGYPRRSFEPIFARLAAGVERAGGRVAIDRPAARIGRSGGALAVAAGRPDSFRAGHDPRRFEPLEGAPERYDAAIATVPNDLFLDLLDGELAGELAAGYAERLRSIEYHAALCMLLELDRPLTRFYWTNVADPELPFIGLIEHTNLVGAERYGGRRFAYVANYRTRGDPLLELPAGELLDLYEPGLRRLNPGFSRGWVREAWLFREPAAQPVVTTGYGRRLPPLATGAPGLYLANTTQVYPEDRGTNYAVRLGEQVAARVTADLANGR